MKNFFPFEDIENIEPIEKKSSYSNELNNENKTSNNYQIISN